VFKKVRLLDHIDMSNQAEFDRLLKRIANNIKKYRKLAGLTQMDMIERGFNYRHYQRLEAGTAGVNLLTLFRLSKAFGVKINKFLV
jgi:transcriptional regulator with XRE-family HTH domain